MQRDRDQITTPPDGRPIGEQPKWRRDFPIDIPEDEYVARRDLIKFMALTSGAFVCGHAFLAARSLLGAAEPVPDAARPIARVDDLQIGESLSFAYPDGENAPRILVRLDEERFVAYDQQCTHLLCPVQARFEEGVLHCPCHNGYFDLQTGNPIAGPPRRALPRVTLDVREGVIYATGMELEAP